MESPEPVCRGGFVGGEAGGLQGIEEFLELNLHEPLPPRVRPLVNGGYRCMFE